MSAHITNDGTYILKKDFKESEIDDIKKQLHILPKITVDYGEPKDESFDIFLDTSTKLYIPRFYALNKFKKNKNTLKASNPLTFNFVGELRDYQKEIIKTVFPILKEKGGGLLSIPTGRGKTVLGLHLATLLKCRTLIVVHKEFLMNQWVERIKQYTDATIGKIQQKKIDIDKDIVVGMLQSISMIDYDVEMFKKFDLVIFDECHHLGSQVFSQALLKLNSPFLLGLSATPNRSDKTEKVFYHFLGEMIYQEVVPLQHKVKIEIHNYTIKHRKFRDVIGKNGKAITPIIINNLTEIELRDDYIFRLIRDLKMKDTSRKILILSGRIVQLQRLEEKLREIFVDDTGFYIGGMKEAELKKSESKDLLFASYEMVTEGLDIQALDTMVLLTPRAKMVQTIGRILRKKPEDYENQPLVIDVVDQIPTCIFLGMARKKVYTSREYEILYHEVKENEIVKSWEHDYAKVIPKFVKNDSGFIDSDEETKKEKNKKEEIKKEIKKEVEIDEAFKLLEEPKDIPKKVRKPRAKKTTDI